jgi:hypothetical protein
MAAPTRPLIETRYDQMFPTLQPAEVDRLQRFGERRAYRTGERLVATGEVSPGMFVVLTGEVAITQHSPLGRDEAIVTHRPGSFMGELSQLSGRPSLVDAHAVQPVEALVIPSRGCLKVASSWVHLRLCWTCGHVGCCDSSPNRHATKHFRATGHPALFAQAGPEIAAGHRGPHAASLKSPICASNARLKAGRAVQRST